MPDVYGTHYATVRVRLEDVTADTAAEFWQALDGQEINLKLSGGQNFVADVEHVAPSSEEEARADG